MQRLKQAKDEAEAEIRAYKDQRENEFRQRNDAVRGRVGGRLRPARAHPGGGGGPGQNAGAAQSSSTQIKADTARKLQELETNVKQRRQDVIDMLLQIAVKVEPRVHQNFKA